MQLDLTPSPSLLTLVNLHSRGDAEWTNGVLGEEPGSWTALRRVVDQVDTGARGQV